ncbi:hypothetical protein G210_0731 [Candida maltosa Xu316]|uniref:Uncharacterized protein n=1 Tax=Candida maltosa (strain Xu316) TaxID=1245528 RepID=M3HMJ7_CANMX|nr:hypothetical protein G210_0731 [Candida maltosa Xu316]
MSSTLFTANNLNSRQESSEGLFTLYKSSDNSRSFNLTNPNLVNVFPSPLTTPPMNNPTNQHVSPKHFTDNKNKTFIDTLEQANLSSFSSYYYLISRDDLSIDITSIAPASHLPNDVEAIAHLKLLKCFGLFKKKVLGDAVGNEATMLWKAFVTNSVRRFIIFATALRKFMMNYNLEQDDGSKISKNPAFVSIMAQLMPPLDVILVWHSFILNSKSFYDVFVRSNMLQFANFPLPLHKICQFIDNHTFEFVVPHEYKHNYLEVLKCFTKSDIDLRYDVTDNFDYTQHYVTVSCPNCYKKLSDPIVLCNGASGFADSGLKCKNIRLVQDSSCYCSWIFLITHSELRKLQLYSDAIRSGILQGTFKFSPSEVILSDPIKSSYKFKEIFNKVWDTNRFKSLEHILQILKDECDKYSLPHTKLLQSYSKFNMISMTVPGSVELGEDLVEMVLKQDKFTTKMNNLNWLHSSNIDHIAYEGCSRYTKFYTMLTNAEVHKSLRPTLDIELMWLTHQLCAFGYYKDCLTSSRHSTLQLKYTRIYTMKNI